MKNVESLLTKFSVFDIRRLLHAKKLYSARSAIRRRVESLTARLADAARKLEKIDRRLGRLMRRTGAAAGRPRRGAGRPAGRKAHRRLRTGSLRSYLAEAIRKHGPAPVRQLAERVLGAGYKTKSEHDVFLRAVNQALHVNKEFSKSADGKYSLRT